jgi:hypothetical protein
MLCPGENPGRHGAKPATNRLSYDTAKQYRESTLNQAYDRKMKTNQFKEGNAMYNTQSISNRMDNT